METATTAPSSAYPNSQRAAQTGEEGEEAGHHEKKPVMKKVKEKVKKIKNAITKKSHGHGDDEGVVDEDRRQHGDLDEEDDGFVEDDEMSDNPEIHGAPMYESSAIGTRTEGKELFGGREGEAADRAGDGLGFIKFPKDPAAPRTEAETKARSENWRGGEEIEASPDLNRSFEAMTLSSQSNREETEPSKTQNNSYTGMVSSAASKVYEMVADAGSAVISKVKPDANKDGADEAVGKQGTGVSIKEYLTEKLTPGEDEKALSELITEAGLKKKDDAPEVPRQVEIAENGGEAGVVERLRETVTSIFGGGESSPKSHAAETKRKAAAEMKEFQR